MKNTKFTFKTEKTGSGRYASFFPYNHIVKLKKKPVGSIEDKKPYRISLQVKKKDVNEDGRPNCQWKWIKLNHDSETLQEAKDFLNKYFNEINTQYQLWMED